MGRIYRAVTAAILGSFILGLWNSSALAQTPALEGVWSGTMTSPDLPAWRAEDYSCGVGCPLSQYQDLQARLRDPANQDQAFSDLSRAAGAAEEQKRAQLLTPAAKARRETFSPADDPGIQCVPFAFFRQALSPLPMRIRQQQNLVVFEYEEWGARREIPLQGARPQPDAAHSRFGHALGRYQDANTLVIETTHLEAAIMTPFARLEHSDRAVATEVYRLSEGGNRLDVELRLTDPETFQAPVVWRRAWLRTPGVELYPDECEIISGEF